MGNISFGQLLEKLIHLSGQKKGLIARDLGYDVSYISKWINSKNLPSTKNINKICKAIGKFLASSADDSAVEDMANYFEIDISQEDDKREFLGEYIEKSLKKLYIEDTGVGSTGVVKETYSQESYNSISDVNPTLKKKYLHNELIYYLDKGTEDIDIIIYVNLFALSEKEKIALFSMRSELKDFDNSDRLKIKFLTGLKHKDNEENILLDYLILVNLVSSNPSLNLKMYDCDISLSAGIFIVKNKIYYMCVHKNERVNLISNISKEKKIVNELYYNLDDSIKTQGSAMCEEKDNKDMIKESIYMEYIMGHDLRWIFGTMNELFMPEDLFIEVAQMVFGDDDEIIKELHKINIFLQNITYKSKLKVLIYESELRKYVSSGELTFFNKNVTLSFKQREKHIKYLEKVLRECEEVEIGLIEGKLVNELNVNVKSSIYLSKNLKFIGMSQENDDENNDYAIMVDDEFKNICNKLFDKIWNENDKVTKDRSYVLERFSKTINYIKVINDKIK